MMQIRSVAVGLAISVYLMINNYSQFVSWALQSSKIGVVQTAVKLLNPTAAPLIGDALVLPGVFMLACIAAGLFVSSLVWPVLEGTYIELVDGLFSGVNKLRSMAWKRLKL
jgi:hypothetical protein